MSKIAHESFSHDVSVRQVTRGDFSVPILQSSTPLRFDEFGVASMTRKIKIGREYSEDHWPEIGDLDFQYEWMKVMDFDVTHEAEGDVLVERYNGIRPNRPPIVKTKTTSAVREQTLYLHDVDGTVVLVYIAPIVTFEWAQAEEPGFERPFFRDTSARPIQELCFKSAAGIAFTGNVVAQIRAHLRYDVVSLSAGPQPVQDGNIWRITDAVESMVMQSYITLV